MDTGTLNSTSDIDHYVTQSSWLNRLDKACLLACQAIAPSWPLDSAIAVNPHWKRINHSVRQVAARMAVLGNIRVFPDRQYIKQAWESGRIQPNDLTLALAQLAETHQAQITEQDCIEALNKPLDLPFLPLLIDALDDDPLRHTRLSWREAITHQVSQTCAAYFDADQADWHPIRAQGLYAFWRDTITHDHGIGVLMGLPNLGKMLNTLPATARDAEQWVMQRLDLPEEAWADYLEALLLTVNGWASWCAYLGWQAELTKQHDHHLRDLLAIRLAWGAILLECKDQQATEKALRNVRNEWHFASAYYQQAEAQFIVDEVWQLAFEIGYQRTLSKSLLQVENTSAELPEVQAAFCIDVRSEPLRRALEQSHPRLQTIGLAGFFGLPIAYSPFATNVQRPQLPGLLAPSMQVIESLQSTKDQKQLSEHQLFNTRQSRLRRIAQWSSTSRWPSAAFSFVEAAGIGYLGALLQWLSPSRKKRQPIDFAGVPKKYRTALRPELSQVDLETKIKTAAQILHALGLDQQMAPLVLLVGHGSQSANNAHAAALDCGACCGQSGEINARVLAGLLNDQAIRSGLKAHQINIPNATVFIAALHNTTTDEIEAYDLDLLPAHGLAAWEKIVPVLQTSADTVRRTRALSLGLGSELETKHSAQTLYSLLQKRANDGAQTRPEWGLAGNAAFIIASRERTRGIKLDGRTFLHDYDATNDNDGSLLELLMTAPMLVTHWINWQYHASTCDPIHLGSGNKVLHNVVGGRIGVFEGNGGDLRIGLSKQSLHNGEQWMHEPLRLTVVIDAPAHAIERVIKQHAPVNQLVHHGWLHLWRFEGNQLRRYDGGKWHAVAL